MDLLYRLAGRIFRPPSDRVIEDVDFLHSRMGLFDELLDFGIVVVTDRRIVYEEFLLGRFIVYGKAGVIRREIFLFPSDVQDVSLIVFLLKGLARAIDFSPGFTCIRIGVDVLEY